MEAIKLRDGFCWTGIIDDKLRVFDIVMYTEFGTTYNSYVMKTGDKVEVSFTKIPPAKETVDKTLKEKAEKLTLTVRTTKTAKKNINVFVKKNAAMIDFLQEVQEAGYTVKYKFYRSEKKSSSYTQKLIKMENRYLNTIGKKGTKYYYKAKLEVYDTEGNLIVSTGLKSCKYGMRTWNK